MAPRGFNSIPLDPEKVKAREARVAARRAMTSEQRLTERRAQQAKRLREQVIRAWMAWWRRG